MLQGFLFFLLTKSGVSDSSSMLLVTSREYIGSSPLLLSAQGQLKSANVGDSGFLVIGRAPDGEQLSVKYHSPQQEHSFGCPYQLGHYEGADSPEDAMLMTVPVGLMPLEMSFCSYTVASLWSCILACSWN